ncbi:hypothetical protein [Hymenobacter sp. 5414T-23]|uniref:hypothetical protein n=1 Tax=Hymenobacter sp. 5414T-23 TaxID=2932252 RepID=UPI001FD15803|nr:hypothetical protein [Hymenobacter sp. 5414T-23]UOQ82462.1 hypothetical protein MUN83_06755 [Hymenobacter sp. 5414T-23]
MATMSSESATSTLTLYVPTDTWPSVVEYYSVALGQEPNPAGPPEAVLLLPDGGELHIIATNDSQQLTPERSRCFSTSPT